MRRARRRWHQLDRSSQPRLARDHLPLARGKLAAPLDAAIVEQAREPPPPTSFTTSGDSRYVRSESLSYGLCSLLTHHLHADTNEDIDAAQSLCHVGKFRSASQSFVPGGDDLRRRMGLGRDHRRIRGHPEPLSARHVRRRFTTAYKLAILRKDDACIRQGELGALLRKEGLYSSHLVTWRQQRETGLTPKKRGRKAVPVDPAMKKLEQENRRRTTRLKKAEALLLSSTALYTHDPP